MEDESKLIKKAGGLYMDISEALMSILGLAPNGLKAKKDVEHEDDDLSYSRGDVVPNWDDPLGHRDGDSNAVKMDKKLKRATRDRHLTQAECLQIEVDTQKLIKAGEDMITFNKTLKEAWLFGKVQTLGQSTAEKETDKNARIVADLLPKVVNGTEADSSKPS